MEGSSSFSVIEPILTHLSSSLANPFQKWEGAACQRRGPGGSCQSRGKRCEPKARLDLPGAGAPIQQLAVSSSRLSPLPWKLRPEQACH